ncbi:hypothetical protein F4780DRAFT_120781 [Xylariomycetidae sp. FL0641]|nr:hypothetical protein F4780DRAFT_120781 [Xylariomycetidae sp. FL0641]
MAGGGAAPSLLITCEHLPSQPFPQPLKINPTPPAPLPSPSLSAAPEATMSLHMKAALCANPLPVHHHHQHHHHHHHQPKPSPARGSIPSSSRTCPPASQPASSTRLNACSIAPGSPARGAGGSTRAGADPGAVARDLTYGLCGIFPTRATWYGEPYRWWWWWWRAGRETPCRAPPGVAWPDDDALWPRSRSGRTEELRLDAPGRRGLGVRLRTRPAAVRKVWPPRRYRRRPGAPWRSARLKVRRGWKPRVSS